MALHKVLPFTVPAPARIGHFRRARPADVIPLHPRDWRALPTRTSAPFVVAAVLLWAAATVLGLFAFWANREWIEVAPLWSPQWPTW